MSDACLRSLHREKQEPLGGNSTILKQNLSYCSVLSETKETPSLVLVYFLRNMHIHKHQHKAFVFTPVMT